MTKSTQGHLNDILAGFRCRYVRQQSVATARCKWEKLSFNPSQQTFPGFLKQYQKLAQEASGEDAPRFIETSFYAKMPPHIKRVLNQARLETESYETMVQHLEKDMELNGLATTGSPFIKGLHNLEPNLQQQQQEKPPKTTGTCFACGNPGYLLRPCRKTNRDKRSQRNQNPAQTTPCETCGKMSHETKGCYSGANWANRPWWETHKTTPPNNIPIPPTITSHPNAAATNHGTNRYRTNELLKPRLRFGDYIDYRYYTISEPQKNHDLEMFAECSGEPSTDWQRRWLIRRLIKFNKSTINKLQYPEWYHENRQLYNSTRRPLPPCSAPDTYIHGPDYGCDPYHNPD